MIFGIWDKIQKIKIFFFFEYRRENPFSFWVKKVKKKKVFLFLSEGPFKKYFGFGDFLMPNWGVGLFKNFCPLKKQKHKMF